MPARVTLRDLGRETGLHFSTVGLALRKDPRVSPETIAKVTTAATRLGYRRDPMLSALSAYRHERNHTFKGTIGILIPKPLVELVTEQSRILEVLASTVPFADKLGYKIEPISVADYDYSGNRLTQVLMARGIDGLLLAPINPPGEFLNLDWKNFSSVAIGYSILGPTLHRACFHTARNMWTHLRSLRLLGYKRIGMVLTINGDIRSDHNFTGSFLAEQEIQPPGSRIRPMIREEITLAGFAEWLQTEQPDCVMGLGPLELGFLDKLGYSVPDDIGFSSYCWNPHHPTIAGLDERWDALGVTSFELLSEMMKNRELGISAFPRFAMVEGQWRSAGTVRSQTKP
jgi:LacI family transcriptional regulator